MMAALELLKAGCRWRIGTGHSVNIWKDPWIPRIPSCRVITPTPHETRIIHVSDLILANIKDWDVQTVNDLLWPKDRELILQIPLSLVGTSDLLVWHYSSNDLFSIKSGYHLALSLASSAGISGPRWCRNTWRVVWQANIPNKVQVFLWRAIRKILPTASNLRVRLLYETVCCPLGGSDAESLEGSRSVWEARRKHKKLKNEIKIR
ncbi:UNVERIFIED_CONTAM: hypothetical protein Slati_3087600 [Sesamum latifolium]|uniref:Reverse transcriptase zinc-binding domain-containing protein n=1 Tax=Sesamum latifolium TaxID=2727402 RepID=A0AAW2UVW3_9LAMI